MISIITVCFNEEQNIERTMRAVLNQTCQDYEYIICDGGSSDNTLQIIERLIPEFENRGISVSLTSKKDGGIYYGMNEGIDIAKGEYILFANAGDCLYDDNVVSAFVSALKEEKPDVIYGDCVLVERMVEKQCICSHDGLQDDMTICHPAVMVSTDIMKKRKFDVSYKVAADYEYLLYLYNKRVLFKHIDKNIAYFFHGGVCTFNFDASIKERCSIWDKYNIPYDSKKQLLKIKKEAFALKIKNCIPLKLWIFLNVSIRKRKKYDNKILSENKEIV